LHRDAGAASGFAAGATSYFGYCHTIVIPAKGVQRHVTLKHDLTLSVYRTGEIPAFAGMTI